MPTLINSITDAVLNIKTVVTLLVSAITAAFVVGGLYWDFKSRLAEAESKIVALDKENSARKADVAALQSAFPTLKADLNNQFARLRTDEVANYSGPIQNTASTHGAGANPVAGPGHCDAGSFVVGIQPLAGFSGITFQCAKLPALAIK
jgi:hypothetical protein